MLGVEDAVRLVLALPAEAQAIAAPLVAQVYRDAMRRGVQPSIIDVMILPQHLGGWFGGGDWTAWRVFLTALFGLPLDDTLQHDILQHDTSQYGIFVRHTSRTIAPTSPAREAWMVVGRRGGKSRIAALIAVYLACYRDYSCHLAQGEYGTIPIIAADRGEARTVMRYVRGFLGAPALRGRVVRQLTESVELQGRLQIEVHTAGFRAVRGYTIVAAICDEIAFWAGADAASPDREVLAALRPGMASIPGALLIGLSSPYARAGVLWEQYHAHYGHDDDPVLVWQASTRDMKPSIDQELIDAAYRDDPDAAAAEYGGEFRRDVESFVSAEAVADATIEGRAALAPRSGVRYVAFVDPSGGAIDSMTLGIAHAERARAVLDALMEVRPPFSPAAVVADFVGLLRQYHIDRVVGDRYGGEWPRERFRDLGIQYELSELVKSDIYLACLARLNSRQVELLDNHQLLLQLRQLERRRGRSGKDIVDHPPKGHDDVINAAAGALVLCVADEGGVYSVSPLIM